MYIKDHMTADPVTITKEHTLAQALELMRRNGFHRLPVVDEKGCLIGLVTGGLVEENSGARNTSLSIYELNYLLNRTCVEEIMIKEVKTIGPDEFLEEAALRMENNKISVLPVVDEEDHIVGIITEHDIFKAFVELMGYTTPGVRFVINFEDKPGVFARVCNLFARENVNLENIGVFHHDRGVETVVKVTGEASVERMRELLEADGAVLSDILQIAADGTTRRYAVKKRKA